MFKWIKVKTYSTKYDLEVEKIPHPKMDPSLAKIQQWSESGIHSPLFYYSLVHFRSDSVRLSKTGPVQAVQLFGLWTLVLISSKYRLKNIAWSFKLIISVWITFLFLEMTYFGRDILKLFTSVWRCLFNKNELARVYTPYFVNWFSRLIP